MFEEKVTPEENLPPLLFETLVRNGFDKDLSICPARFATATITLDIFRNRLINHGKYGILCEFTIANLVEESVHVSTK